MQSQAVALLCGLEAIASGAGFLYRHQASGFTFQLAPVPPSPGSSAACPACEAELAYQPMHLGLAAQVGPVWLPHGHDSSSSRTMSQCVQVTAD